MGKIFGISDILNAVFNRDANKLKVETDLQIDAVTATDVTIHDAVATDNKLKVNEDGSVPVELTGSNATIDSAPVVGIKTVTTTAAELFAGASRLANRYAMIVYNESSEPVYWGSSGVTAATGFPLLPQDSVVFQFNPSVATAIYFIAGSNAAVRVVELA